MAPPTTAVAYERDLINPHFDDPKFSDLKIKLYDRVVYVHRVVLCRGSEYFTSLLAGRYKESNAKQVELQEDDPEVMMVLLRYLYALPYATVDSEDVGDDCLLHPHALVYVVAEKYQITRLRDEAYKNIQTIIGSWGVPYYGFVDFPAALRTIFTATLPTNKVRALMVQVCIAGLSKLRANDDFAPLLLELPDLGAEIITHIDLVGDWLCPCGPDCDGLPTCFSCVEKNDDYTPPLEQPFTHKHRDQEKWLCPSCGELITPQCSMCEGIIKWSNRRRTREYSYYNRSP